MPKLHDFLKENTRTDHEAVEQLMFAREIMNGTLSVMQYQQILAANYYIHLALEDLLFAALNANTAALLNPAERHKMAALSVDMREAQITPCSRASHPLMISRLPGEASALGALYVLEGATLGGHIIAKKLRINPALRSLNLAFNYYGIYGDNLFPNWKIFCAVLDLQPEDTYAVSLESAKNMFACIAGEMRNRRLNDEL